MLPKLSSTNIPLALTTLFLDNIHLPFIILSEDNLYCIFQFM